MTGLEQRLLETELALIETMLVNLGQDLSSTNPDQLSEVQTNLRRHASAQNKSARMDEWEQNPLRTSECRHMWLTSILNNLGIRIDLTPQLNTVHGQQYWSEQHSQSGMSVNDNPSTAEYVPIDHNQYSTFESEHEPQSSSYSQADYLSMQQQYRFF